MSKNIVAFIVFSAAVLAVSLYIQNQFPPPKVDAKKAESKDKKAAEKGKDADEKDAEKKVDKNKKPDDKDAKDAEKKDDSIPAPTEVAEFTMGDDTSNLAVVFTNRGAGVRKLTLTRFEAANYLGQPVLPKRELEFIQDDPYISSFRMYHFPDPEAETPSLGLGESLWHVVGKGVEADGNGWKLAFWTHIPNQPKIKITKTYRLKPGDYHIGVNLEFTNLDSENNKSIRYQFLGSHGLPVEGEWYTPQTNIRNAVVGIVDSGDNLSRTIEDSGRISAKSEGEPVLVSDAWMQYAGVMTQYFASVVVVDHEQPFGKWQSRKSILQRARASRESTEVKGTLVKIDGDVVMFRDDKKKLITARMLPRAKEHLNTLNLGENSTCVVNYSTDPQTKEAFIVWFRLGESPRGFFDDITVRLTSDVVDIPKGGTVGHNFLLYHGPVKTRLLAQSIDGSQVRPELVEEYTETLHLNTLTDYPSVRIPGWNYLILTSTRLMHVLLYYLHFISFGSWGVSILLLTICVRAAMYPISRKQALMSQKMQALAPEIKKLQEKHKDDKAAVGQATMELYRKHNVNPAAGCLPLLLQMPIFMGLYFCLQESVQFRLAKFLWIENLAAPDMLFGWGQSIPIISDPNNLGSSGGFFGGIISTFYLGPFFNLLPVIAVGFMIMQQKMMTPPPQNEEQATQQRMMKIMMGVMGVLFYKVAAGLCIYFISSSVWGLIERKMLPKKAIVAGESPAKSNGKPIVNARDRRREQKREREEQQTAWMKLKEWWKQLLESAEKK